MLQGLPPLLDASTRILLLGSFPGVASLVQAQYYAHPRNQFWRLLGACLDDAQLATLPYAERLRAAAAHGVGLWDVVAECRREGSLDAAIMDAQVNPLAAYLRDTSPRLARIGFNGALSWKHGQHLAEHGYQVFKLPSSSPAAASLNFEQKLALWRPLFADALT
ncbi:DNA-deoxyinosine glycosylase [Pigmentiphaga aceris]|uniref:DNA-deoxyinosine glycosylase n=1 Tax=Pigmentiphaga aceris TaxID=1940612 RepID=A0A5C0B485_9BURK|nr:DNA-deoxyinosine glycosylase [Pigmentiphaga aceris]QEI08070.1 DNA-deoxyinosine glycosylase [Pigmentiphaga aceris]